MTDQEILHTLAGAGAGGGIIFTLGKLYIQSIVKTLEESAQKIHDVFVKLSAISVKLELLDHHHCAITKLNETLQDHAQIIAVLKSKVESIKNVEK